jgi:hypothetical protein
LAALAASLIAMAPEAVGSSAAGAASVATFSAAETRRLGDGAWSWFQHPRAIVTGGGCEVLASAASGTAAAGTVSVSSTYPQTSAGNPTPRASVVVDTTLTFDDHTSGALLKLANGEILTAWSGHASDRRIRVAVRSGGARRWTRLPGFVTAGRQTYNNLFQLPDGTVLDFTRRSARATPRLYRSADNGRTWSHAGELVRWTGDADDHRPYVQYAQQGARIWFVATLGHPQLLAERGVDSPTYAGYLEGATVHRADGSVAGALGGGVEVDDLTPVYQPPAQHSAWLSSLGFDRVGNPVALLSVRDRRVPGTSPASIRYVQARWNGAWVARDVAPGGRVLYGTEEHYAGTATGDPGDADHLVISTSVDPATGTDLRQFDLFDGRTADGVTWTWTRLTATPKKDDLRPVLTSRSVNGMQALVWFQGRYTTYSDFDTDVKYRVLNPHGVACP